MWDSMKVSLSGMEADDTWIRVISNNLANAQSVATPQGGPYLRESVVFETQADGGVEVSQIAQENRPPELRYDPGNPMADSKGMVAYPAVDLAQEMSELAEASRSYQANSVAISNSKTLARDALQI